MTFAALLTLFSFSLSSRQFGLGAVCSISVSYLTQCQLSFAECHAPLQYLTPAPTNAITLAGHVILEQAR